MCKHILLGFLLVIVYALPSAGQYEHLALLNDQTLSINRLSTIPGVTWVYSDNPAFDVNHQRFFFQGNATQFPPWYLYTLDVTTGNVVYQQLCPGNDAVGEVLGMQYDNVKDTLYCLCAGSDRRQLVLAGWIQRRVGSIILARWRDSPPIRGARSMRLITATSAIWGRDCW